MKTTTTYNQTAIDSIEFRSQKRINPHIEAIRKGDNKGIKAIYQEFFVQAKRKIVRLGGKPEDAEDIFQEALIIIFEKIQQNTLPMITSFRTYFLGICKYLWKSNSRQKYKREITGISQAYHPDDIDIAEKIVEKDKHKFFQRKMDLLSKDQQEVLNLYFDGFSMKQIAHKMGYGSAAYAKKKKAVVKKKLVGMIQLDPIYRELKQA